MGKNHARGLLSPPRIIWVLETIRRRFEAGPCRKVGGGTSKPGSPLMALPAGCGNRPQVERPEEERRLRETRETHFLAQVKEHSGNPERTTPADKARHRKLLLSRQSLVPAALGSSGRPGNRRRWVASGAPRDTSGVVLVSPGVVRLRGRRGAGRPGVVGRTWSLCSWALLTSALARSLSCPTTGRASRTGHTSGGRGGTRLRCQYQVSKGAH